MKKTVSLTYFISSLQGIWFPKIVTLLYYFEVHMLSFKMIAKYASKFSNLNAYKI
jgi:hypothetical protein